MTLESLFAMLDPAKMDARLREPATDRQMIRLGLLELVEHKDMGRATDAAMKYRDEGMQLQAAIDAGAASILEVV